ADSRSAATRSSTRTRSAMTARAGARPARRRAGSWRFRIPAAAARRVAPRPARRCSPGSSESGSCAGETGRWPGWNLTRYAWRVRLVGVCIVVAAVTAYAKPVPTLVVTTPAIEILDPSGAIQRPAVEQSLGALRDELRACHGAGWASDALAW